jgi:hypothetical protein
MISMGKQQASREGGQNRWLQNPIKAETWGSGRAMGFALADSGSFGIFSQSLHEPEGAQTSVHEVVEVGSHGTNDLRPFRAGKRNGCQSPKITPLSLLQIGKRKWREGESEGRPSLAVRTDNSSFLRREEDLRIIDRRFLASYASSKLRRIARSPEKARLEYPFRVKGLDPCLQCAQAAQKKQKDPLRGLAPPGEEGGQLYQVRGVGQLVEIAKAKQSRGSNSLMR